MSDAAGDHVEIELKYGVADAAELVRALDRVPSVLHGIDLGAWRTRDTHDVYVDTADGAIAAAGYGARLRTEGGGVTLTLKARGRDTPRGRGAPDALHRRREVEGPAGADLDPGTWPPSAASTLVLELVGEARLGERFTIEQVRRERELRARGDVAALTVDDVRVLAAGREVGRFGALEVELVSGDEAFLSRIDGALAGTSLVGAERRSKEAIAMALVAIAATAPGVRSDDPLAEAARKVIRMHLLRMVAREEGVRSGTEIEDVHKMRVATRRLRAAWRTFDGAFQGAVAGRAVGELRRIAEALGAVRDLDVQLEALEGWAATQPDPGSVGPLSAAWRARRTAAHVQLTRLLASRRYRRFVEASLAFAETAGAGARRSGSVLRVRETAGSRVWAAYEAVRSHEAGIGSADTEGLHELRIDGKRFRYALESFAEVLGPEAAWLIERVTALQDHLGAVNDSDVAARMVHESLLASGSDFDPAARAAMEHYLAARERDLAARRSTLLPVWEPILSTEFRRKLGRAVSRL